MSEDHDWSASWDELIGRSNPEPINHDLEEMGFSLSSDGRLIWEETLDYDPTSDFCRAIDAKIERDDRTFLSSCGIQTEEL